MWRPFFFNHADAGQEHLNQNFPSNVDVLLTVHLSIFILLMNQIDAQNFCFTISLFHNSTCFEHMCSKHVEAWNKLIVKQKFCASSWLIIEIIFFCFKCRCLLFVFSKSLYSNLFTHNPYNYAYHKILSKIKIEISSFLNYSDIFRCLKNIFPFPAPFWCVQYSIKQ